jgi:hypothetical protein
LELDAARAVFASLGAEPQLAAVTVLLDRSAADATHGLPTAACAHALKHDLV